MDGGIRLVLEELRDLKRELAEDRKQAAADRVQAAADRQQAADDRRRSDEQFAFATREATTDRAGITALLSQLIQIAGSQKATLGRMEATLKVLVVQSRRQTDAIAALAVQSARQTDALVDLTRTLRARPHGRNGANGANGKRKH